MAKYNWKNKKNKIFTVHASSISYSIIDRTPLDMLHWDAPPLSHSRHIDITGTFTSPFLSPNPANMEKECKIIGKIRDIINNKTVIVIAKNAFITSYSSQEKTFGFAARDIEIHESIPS